MSKITLLLLSLALVASFWITPDVLLAQVPRTTTSIPKPGQTAPTTPTVPAAPTVTPPSVITQATALTIMSLLPFIVMILTSFLKIVIVLSLLRNALGVQQAPPNQIINGVAFMLSLFIMYPTALKIYDASQKLIKETKRPESILSRDSAQYIVEIATEAREALR